jgi:hypothetical protein
MKAYLQLPQSLRLKIRQALVPHLPPKMRLANRSSDEVLRFAQQHSQRDQLKSHQPKYLHSIYIPFVNTLVTTSDIEIKNCKLRKSNDSDVTD